MQLRLAPFLTLPNVLTVAVLGLATFFPAPTTARLRHLENLFVFSDSLADIGNSFSLTRGLYPPPPYYMGRASNGPVAVEYLWQLFNPGSTDFTSSLEGGTNYAIGGATTGLESFYTVAPNTTIPDALKILFDKKANAWSLDEFENDDPVFNGDTSLFVVWLFPNDVLYWLRTGGGTPGTFDGGPSGAGSAEALITNGIQNITGTIIELAGKDARNFLVPNMPDLGKTPLFLDRPESSLLSDFTAEFNQNLALALDALQLALPTADITQFQADELFQGVLEDPAAFGFSNVTEACIINLAITSECKDNESSYLFWDDFHPTTAAHQLFGESFYEAVRMPVPVPVPLPVMGLGVTFGWSRRLRRRLRGEMG